ncbi:unnamed protein product [Caenorhabditis auriculariae]|uniref:Uncharacterized protein n=1 Tax=Caenorhabditis auriculariae TaxID=2777116 RepID=A0A8S1HXE2_9PELO|nr:unnamed protein product [Caenorhabditis auriculariae]
MNTLEEPGEELKTFRPCDDPYCYAILSAEAEGGLTTVSRGCHSRKLVMHHMFFAEDQKFHNNSRWKETEVLAKQPTCADLLWDEPADNSTTSMCLDYSYTQDAEDEDEPTMFKGRLCCCKGGHRCNEEFMWSDPAITMDELTKKLTRRDSGVSSESPRFTKITVAIIFFIVHYFN